MKGFIVSLALCCCALPIISPLHSGGTDGAGGHYDHSTGEYHYHHGKPAHQHYGGKCPYDYRYDCGKEGCDIQDQHGHINKPTTTTPTTTTTTTSRTESQDNDKVFLESWPLPLQLLFGVSIAFFPITISLIYEGFVKIKDFISKQRKK